MSRLRQRAFGVGVVAISLGLLALQHWFEIPRGKVHPKLTVFSPALVLTGVWWIVCPDDFSTTAPVLRKAIVGAWFLLGCGVGLWLTFGFYDARL